MGLGQEGGFEFWRYWQEGAGSGVGEPVELPPPQPPPLPAPGPPKPGPGTGETVQPLVLQKLVALDASTMQPSPKSEVTSAPSILAPVRVDSSQAWGLCQDDSNTDPPLIHRCVSES